MISPERSTINNILTVKNRVLSIPNYQRSFDWGKEELQEFIDDLNTSSKDKEKNLFLGNFIFDVSDTKGNIENIKVVDGQQRLTTISLTFIVLREMARKLGDTRLEYDIQGYISDFNSLDETNEVKFKTSENIRDVYEFIAHPNWSGEFPNEVNGKKVRRQRNKIKPIYDYIKNQFNKYDISEIKNLVESLRKTYVVIIEVDNKEDMFAIFERTNARGLDLNIGDLVKNYIFSYEHPELENQWNFIVENASGNLAKMLKYNWVSQKGHIMQSKLYRNLKKGLNESAEVESYISDLSEFSEYYNMINSPNENSVKNWLENFKLDTLCSNTDYIKIITRVFQALKLFRVTQVIPLIFSIFKNYKSHKQEERKYLFRIFHTIEKYHFTNNVVCGRVANEVEKFYAEKAMEFYSNKNTLSTEANLFINEINKKKATKDEFISQFIENINYSDNNRNKVLINYVFDRINNFDFKKNKPVPGAQYVDIFKIDEKITTRNYNIEHLLNQKFRDETNPNYDSSIIDQIGNLLVISRHTNSGLPDNFKEKIIYFKSDPKYINLSYLKKFIDNIDENTIEWNRLDIENRSKEIAELSYEKVWHF